MRMRLGDRPQVEIVPFVLSALPFVQKSEAAAAPTAGDDQGSLGGPEGEGKGATAANREGSLRANAAGAPSGDTAATRLWRATEAARELGLSVAA